MDEGVNVGLLAFLTLAVPGLLFMLAGILTLVLEKRKKGRCTAMTMGTIVRYSFANRTPSPVASYTVGGVSYEKKRRFRGVVEVRRKLSPKDWTEESQSCYISENDVLHIRGGAALNLRAMAESLYPMGSSIPVWYDPEKPRRAYVERVPAKGSIVGWVFIWVGLGLAALGTLMSFVL